MPTNELEKHPFLNYLDKNIKINFNKLIIGSFPIYDLTSTVDENFNEIENRFNQQNAFVDFFYGSKKSYFWKLFFDAHDIVWDFNQYNAIQNKEKIIQSLFDNTTLITDVIKYTNRIKYSAADTDLFTNSGIDYIDKNISLNKDLPAILNNNKIECLYFTAKGLTGKTPFGWFRQIFNNQLVITNQYVVGNIIWALKCLINNKEYKVFLLPTPKERGIHYTQNDKNPMFSNFIFRTDPNLHNYLNNTTQENWSALNKCKLSNLRSLFLIECNKQAFINQNLGFQG